jgi:hypothetical protein
MCNDDRAPRTANAQYDDAIILGAVGPNAAMRRFRISY